MGNPRGRENSGSPMSQSRTTPWDIIGQDPMTSLVLDTISVGVVVVNAEGKFLIWNQTATAILGMDADDVPPEEWSHHYHLMSPQDEEPMPADQLPLVRALRGEDAEVEILIWNPTRATKLLITCTARPMRDEAGEIIGAVASFHDITRTRRVEHELRTFAQSISHDLKAPLTGLLGFVDTLVHDHKDRLDADGQDALAYIDRCASRMVNLIEDLSNHAALDGELEHEIVDLDVVVHDVLDELQPVIDTSGARVDVVNKLPTVVGYRTPLQQMLQNLVANAVKFVEPGGQAHVEVGAVESERSVQIYVKDHGIGIEEPYLRAIFEVFRRLHPQSDYPGTGIGLAIVKKVVELHRGAITVESKVGEGSTFRVQIARNLADDLRDS